MAMESLGVDRYLRNYVEEDKKSHKLISNLAYCYGLNFLTQ